MGDYYCVGSLDQHVVTGIFVASLRAVGCAATLASAGFWLARQGVMTPALSKGLSTLSVKLAIPCLLFSSVVPGVSAKMLSYAWPLFLLPAVHLLLGCLVGWLTVLIVKPPENFRLGTVAACTFGNTTGIPVVLLSVLQQSLGRAVFAELADPLLFLSMQLLTYPLLQWALGALLMRHAAARRRAADAAAADPLNPLAADSPLRVATLVDSPAGRLLDSGGGGTGGAGGASGGDGGRMKHASRSCASASCSYIPMISQGEDDGGILGMGMQMGMRAAPSVGERLYAIVQTSASKETARWLCTRATVLLRLVAVPPVIGVVLGALVGMLGRGLVLPPEVAPLGWLYMGVSKLGAAAVPLNLILLGTALSRGPVRAAMLKTKATLACATSASRRHPQRQTQAQGSPRLRPSSANSAAWSPGRPTHGHGPNSFHPT